MNKTAKEMFEELGYKIAVNDEDVIIYHHYGKGNDTREIFFRLKHTYTYNENIGYGAKLSYDSGSSYPLTITINEHLAIHQQLKELGWLD